MSAVLKINPPTQPKAKRAKVDWAALEPDWRAGIKSVLQIASEYGKATNQTISHTAINKHFKKLKVPRDLKAKIQAKADAMVSAAMVSGRVSIETTASEADIINNAAIGSATMQLTHRTDINRYRTLANKLLGELEVHTDNPEGFAELAHEVIWQKAEGIQTKDEIRRMERMQQLFDMVMSNPGRVDSMKKLADTLKTLIGLEREAFGLDKGIDKSQSVGEFLESLK